MFDKLQGQPVEAMLVETRRYPWGTGDASGLVIECPGLGDAVIEPDFGGEAKLNKLLDRRIRLTPDEIELLLDCHRRSLATETPPLLNDFRPSFFDPDATAGEAAVMPVSIPHRPSSSADTGWLVVLLDAGTPAAD